MSLILRTRPIFSSRTILTTARFNSSAVRTKGSPRTVSPTKSYHTQQIKAEKSKFVDEFNTQLLCESTFIRLKDKTCPFAS